MTVKQTNKRSTAARASKPAAPAPGQEKEQKAAAAAPVAEQAPAKPEPAPIPDKESEPAPAPDKAPDKEPEPAPQADNEPGQGAKEAADKDQGKDASDTGGPVQDGAAQGDTGAAPGGVQLEVVTRLPRRIRAGVTVTRAPTRVEVSEDVAAQLEADRHIKVKRL